MNFSYYEDAKVDFVVLVGSAPSYTLSTCLVKGKARAYCLPLLAFFVLSGFSLFPLLYNPHK
jgi:hypothetical protein